MLTVFLSSLLALAPAAIQDEEQLRAHLCTAETSPLDALSRGARLRLLENLRFGPGGAQTVHPPLGVDLTAEEKDRIVDLLGLEAYRDWPRAQRSTSAGHDSNGYPAPDSAFCAGEGTLGQWARAARAREGDLSIAVARASARIESLVSEGAAFEDSAPAIAAAAEPVLRLVDPKGWAKHVDAWVLRDTADLLGFAARLSEDSTLIDAALRVQRLAADKTGIEADSGLIALREALGERLPGLRRIGRLQPSGDLEIETVEEPPRFVLVSSAGCGFSRDLLGRVAADENLTELARRHLTVLAPGREFDAAAEAYGQWNAAHPAVPYQAWIVRSEWPEINLDSTPVLYEITADGAVKLFQGFPPEDAEERLDTLRSALRAAGENRE